jgi:hypothetical protein
MVAAGLILAPTPTLAQSTVQPTANTSAPDSIGPRELQNFSLDGTVTRRADTPAPTAAPSRTQSSPPRQTAERSPPSEHSGAPAPTPREARSTQAEAAPAARPPASPPIDLAAAASATPASLPQPGFAPPAEPAAASFEPERKLLLWPWLLLVVVLGAGGAVLLRRRRTREAFAGGPQIDSFAAPEPQSTPRAAVPQPAPAPPAAVPEPPKPIGIVSSRLRPWLDLTFAPIGCVVDDDRVALEFEIQLSNSGSAPARDILVEASMFNAGANQDHDIGAFFARPLGQGERIEVMAPLQQVSIRTSLVAPRANIQIFEMGGRKVFVPLAAFNVLYRLPSGTGQTSLAYMLGRETNTEKLGPLRADLGPRTFTGLGIRPLPIGVRS